MQTGRGPDECGVHAQDQANAGARVDGHATPPQNRGGRQMRSSRGTRSRRYSVRRLVIEAVDLGGGGKAGGGGAGPTVPCR
jgi:hypothetical protein